MRRLSLLCLGLLAFQGACGGSPVDRPEEVVSQFIELMDRSDFDERALRDAYGLLDKAACERLAERAERARTLSGGEYEPWEMLVPGRFRLHFAPADRGGMHSKVSGDSALVTVVGEGSESAQVPMVRQDGQWRIALRVPPMSQVAGFGRVAP